MIEWWQAFLISVPSVILGGLVTGGVALMLQRRQQTHDTQMQAQRLEAERQSRHHNALRELRQTRLQPFFDILAEVDTWLTRNIWEEVLDEAKRTGTADRIVAELFPDGITPEIRRRADEKMKEVTAEPAGDLLLRAGSVIIRTTDDKALFEDARALLDALAQDDAVAVIAMLPRVHARLEQYVAAGASGSDEEGETQPGEPG